AEKNELFMQIYADVIGHPMLIAGSAQTPALGSAIAAAVTAGEAKGGHASFERAQEKMSTLKEKRFTPDPAAARVYDELYGLYRELHDRFGGVPGAKADFPSLMKRLLAIREREIARRS
ncbi:MAG TPA: FGGY-family carbohydrate kinase, partial [Gaiellaceae bacterium]|nr:FGGY-family carbohydrate kinase [Gaiellaceae bacterium]